MKSGRSKKALQNTIAGFANEFVVLVCGLILPRLILNAFGSSYNGITSSITQFISCIALMKSGIGGVTRAALYKPLANNDYKGISEIIVQTEKFLRKIALIFIGFIVIFACLYPLYVRDFSWLFTASLILIIAITTFMQYYFGMAYQMLLSADQRQCVVSIINIVTSIVNTIIAAALIKCNFGIHVVKLGSATIFALNPLVTNWYARKYYKIDHNVKPNADLLVQRWDAMGHEVANFVNSNTDIILLTIFTTIKEVSVYTVYYAVIKGIRTIVTNFITGFGAAFGNMYARKEYELMKKNLEIYEVIVFSISAVAYSATAAMLVPYALLYTRGVTDVEYSRPLFSMIITIAGVFSCYRIPYQTIVTAVGHYKQTRNGAFLEAILNIVVSVLCVIKWGLVGVAIGTLVATIFRSCQYAIYLGENVIKRSIWIFILHVFVSTGIIILTYSISRLFLVEIDSVYLWLCKATAVSLIAAILTIITDLLLFRNASLNFMSKFIGIFSKK